MEAPALLLAVVLVPLVGAVLTPAISRGRAKVAYGFAVAVMSATTAISVFLTLQVARQGPFSYWMGAWPPPYGIELRFDEFSAVTVVISFLGLMCIIFSGRYAERELEPPRLPYYYTLLLLNLTGMIGFVVTGDLFNLFVFMEILSLSGYALVAVSGKRIAEMAAFKYLLMGAVSSLLVLFAIGILYSITGTLNMADIARRIPAYGPRMPAMVALAAFMLGFSVKAALFPLHIWLPDAHAIAPSPVSAVLSGLVVKMGIVGMLRVYQMYMGGDAIDISGLNGVLMWLGAISIVVGAFFAIFQDDIKMMLAYSTISNIGYIVMGFGLASSYGLIGSVVHVFNHSLIKACLFLGAGALIHQTGFRRLSDLQGVGRSMPLTTGAIAVGAVSIVGIPPTAGFLCKWYIALGAIQAGQPWFGFALVFGALFIFVYYIRMLNSFYFQAPVHKEVSEAHEAPLSMLVPVLVLAALCLIMGVLGRIPLAFIEPAVNRMLAP